MAGFLAALAPHAPSAAAQVIQVSQAVAIPVSRQVRVVVCVHARRQGFHGVVAIRQRKELAIRAADEEIVTAIEVPVDYHRLVPGRVVQARPDAFPAAAAIEQRDQIAAVRVHGDDIGEAVPIQVQGDRPAMMAMTDVAPGTMQRVGSRVPLERAGGIGTAERGGRVERLELAPRQADAAVQVGRRPRVAPTAAAAPAAAARERAVVEGDHEIRQAVAIELHRDQFLAVAGGPGGADGGCHEPALVRPAIDMDAALVLEEQFRHAVAGDVECHRVLRVRMVVGPTRLQVAEAVAGGTVQVPVTAAGVRHEQIHEPIAVVVQHDGVVELEVRPRRHIARDRRAVVPGEVDADVAIRAQHGIEPAVTIDIEPFHAGRRVSGLCAGQHVEALFPVCPLEVRRGQAR